MNKNEIKNRIDELGNKLIPLYGRGVGSPGTVLTIYLGQQTRDELQVPLEEAFFTSFNAKPAILNLTLENLTGSGEDMQTRLTSTIADAGKRGEDLHNLRVIFVALMDDPVFTDGCSRYVEGIDQAFLGLKQMGLHLRECAFYGLFRAINVSNHDYQNAFSFVKAGKHIWNDIYHIEIPFFVENMKRYANLIAVHSMSNTFRIKQDPSVDTYAWESIYLHCLKVPEFMITRILYMIYDSQIHGSNNNAEEWKSLIGEALERGFDRIFGDDLSGCEQYIPLKYKEESPVVPQKTGFFQRKNTVAAQKYSFTDIAKDASVLEKFAVSVYNDKIFQKNEYDRIFEEVISSAYSINDNMVAVVQVIDKVLKTIEDNYLERKQFSSNQAQAIEEDADIDRVLELSFQREKEKAILIKKIEMIQKLRENLNSNEAINEILGKFFNRNSDLLSALEDLSINEYGGTLGEFKINSVPKFQIYQPVDEVLQKLDQGWLANITRDRDRVLEQLKPFLIREIGHMSTLHMLGEIGPGLSTLNPVTTVVLMPPTQGGDPEFKDAVQQAGGMEIKTDGVFRESTFYMLSGRKYSSEKYIRRYRGGND